MNACRYIALLSLMVLLPVCGYATNPVEPMPRRDTSLAAAPAPFRAELNIAIEWFKKGEYDSANCHFYRSAQLFTPTNEISQNEFDKKISVLLTHSYKALCVKDSAILYARNVVRLAENLGDNVLKSEYLYTLAILYRDYKERELAIKYFLESAELARLIDYHSYAISGYATASGLVTDKKYAITLAKMALECAKRDVDQKSIAGQYISLAATYYNDQQYDLTADSYRAAMEIYKKLKDTAWYNIAKSGLMFVFNKTGKQDSAKRYLSTPGEKIDFKGELDSLVAPNTIQGVVLDLVVATTESSRKELELDVLSRQYWQEQADSLRMRIWLISIAGGLVTLVLLLLYGRQKLRVRANTRYIDGLENERQRISKELHDGVCNDLLALEMRVKEGREDDSLAMLKTVRQEVRMLSHELMPPAFQYATIEEILEDYTSSLALTSGVTLKFTCDKSERWGSVAQALSFQIYRIVQEAVSNSLKHSSATNIEVELTHATKQIRLVITDDGGGFDQIQSAEGIGLRTLRDRAQSIGGALDIHTDARGTKITLTYNDNGAKSKHTSR